MNFGCGYEKREGYLNVDIDPACRPDLLIREGDYSRIPHDHFEEIYASDVLEHILRAQTLSALLDWASWLKTGGTLWFQTSSMLGVAEWLQRTKTFSEHHRWTIGMFGSQAHEGDFHHTGFTELTLKVHLLAAELELQKMEMRDGWLVRITATKERAWDGYIASLSRETDEAFIRETFQRAVGQEPSADQLRGYTMRLQTRSTTRWRIAKEVFQSDHRLFVTAARYSL
jgi:hypothetical protein